MEKIKFEQYRVGVHNRPYHVLVVPLPKYAFGYYDNDDIAYEIDGDTETYLQIQHAISILIDDPTKIIYFPLRKTHMDMSHIQGFEICYNAILMRSSINFKSSDWNACRRQLKPQNRLKNYVLNYNPNRYLFEYKEIEKSPERYYRLESKRSRGPGFKKLVGDTIVYSYSRDFYIQWHNDIYNALHNENLNSRNLITIGCDNGYSGPFGWVHSNSWKNSLLKFNAEQKLKKKALATLSS